MNDNDKKIYSEVYSVLNLLGEEYINKLPAKLFEFIKNKRIKTYNPEYTLEVDLDKQNIQKDSLTMLAIINYKFWTQNEEEKRELFNLFKNNQK